MGSGPKHHQISRASSRRSPRENTPLRVGYPVRRSLSSGSASPGRRSRRALRDLQDQGLVERRVGSGSFVRQPGLPEAVRQLGLLIPGLGRTEIFEVICGELAGLARVRGYGLLWGGGGRRPNEDVTAEDAEAICDQFLGSRAAGVFFAPFEHIDRREEVNRRLVEKLRLAGVAVVLLDRDLGAFPSRSDLDLVGVDNFAGGYRLADHLLKLGCRNPIFAMRPRSASTVNARIAGAREAILDHGLTVPALVRPRGGAGRPQVRPGDRREGADGRRALRQRPRCGRSCSARWSGRASGCRRTCGW